MYQGYRIKVNDTIIDNMMIKRGTYYTIPASRVLDSYYDAAGGFHEELHPVKKMEIGFTIREHSMEEHIAIMAAFPGRNVSVEYWNDTTGEYKMGVFRVAEDLKSAHKHAAGRIRYDEIEVVLKEN